MRIKTCNQEVTFLIRYPPPLITPINRKSETRYATPPGMKVGITRRAARKMIRLNTPTIASSIQRFII